MPSPKHLRARVKPTSPIRRIAALAVLLLAGLFVVPGAAQAAGSDAPTPYTVTVDGVQLPSGTAFPDGGHVNIRTNQGNKGIHFESLNNQPSGKWIGESFLPWSAFGLDKQSLCVTWVQVSLYNEHFGEGGQVPVGLGCKQPESKSSALYIYKKVDSNKPASWENSGRQTFIKAWDGWSWTSTSTLPANVCGDGWAYQQDQGKLAKDKWPTIVDRSTGEGVLGWPPIVDAKHGELSELVAVPDCEQPKPDPLVETVSEQRSTCEAGVESREGTKTTDWVKQDDKWVSGEPTTEWGDWTFVRDLTTQEKLELGCFAPLTPIAPTFDVADQCEERSFVGIPLQEGVVYRIDGEAVEPGEHAFDGTIVVTAHAAGDVPLAEGDWSWTETAKYTECPPVVPEKPAPIVEPRQWETSVCLTPLDGTRQVSQWHEEITTDWLWDEESWAWVKGEPVSTGKLLVESEVVEDESCAPAPKPTDPPTSKPTPKPQPTDSPTKQVVVKKPTPKPTPTKATPKSQLAQTGASPVGYLVVAGGLVVGGVVTLLIVRRRQASTD